MVYGVILFLLCLIPHSRAEVPPINEDDPELYVEWTTPRSYEFWWRYSSGAEFCGHLFAGKYQFPWLVDIRSNDLDMDEWSVGNLLTLSHVLTSSRGILFLLAAEKKLAGEDGSSQTYEYTSVHVNYATTYLWEDYKFNQKKNWLLTAEEDLFATDVKDTGTRYARYVFTHPLWSEGAMAWDVGIIKLNNPIKPLPPLVNHMPFWFDFIKGTVTEVDLSQMDGQRRVCYIASFGKQWLNLWESIVNDYKVKYRVYYTKMDSCKRVLHLFKSNKPHVKLVYDKDKKGEDPKHLMCFITRARVGTVCDHDRGAPLVCDNLVYGFVVRGANYTNCNNLLPLPFLIQKSTLLNSYFASVISHVFIPDYSVPKEKAKASTGQTTPSAYIQAFTFLLLLWHNLPNPYA